MIMCRFFNSDNISQTYIDTEFNVETVLMILECILREVFHY